MATEVLTVSELLRSVRDCLEHRFPLLWIRGEVSNLSRAGSGHFYFTLKDGSAQVDCVMFRTRAAAVEGELRDGAQFEVRALVTLYEPRGRFQLNVEAIRPAGVGPLYERFVRLKEKLERDGLFDASVKRALPQFPRCIGVVTSPGAAALHDVLTTLARRNRSMPVIVYPIPVQGEGAAEHIASMIATASARAECDVLLLVRGGGSIENLWQFNEESVARAIRASRIPVLAGIGHETDFTIADFAADQRAPTPTAAAELACPARADLLARIAACARCMSREMRRRLEYCVQAVDGCARRLAHPAERLRAATQHLAHLTTRLCTAISGRLAAGGAELNRLRASLAGLDPGAVLARGYSITCNARGEVIRDAASVKKGDTVKTTLARGRIESEVKTKASG